MKTPVIGNKRNFEMTLLVKNQNLQQEINAQSIANMVSKSLRLEHQNDSSAVKEIGKATGISYNTVAKWYHSKNAPQSKHLLVLASIYPRILNGLLNIIASEVNRTSKVPTISNTNQEMIFLHQIQLQPDYMDKYVHFEIKLPVIFIKKLNQRQIWFMSEVKKNKMIGTQDLSIRWQCSTRTSRRDIKKLLKLNLIELHKTKRGEHYTFANKEF